MSDTHVYPCQPRGKFLSEINILGSISLWRHNDVHVWMNLNHLSKQTWKREVNTSMLILKDLSSCFPMAIFYPFLYFYSFLLPIGRKLPADCDRLETNVSRYIWINILSWHGMYGTPSTFGYWHNNNWWTWSLVLIESF